MPTSVVVGPDGYVYVGELKGFPFRPGSSHVWRIDPDAEGASCSVNMPSDACTVYQSGLTAIQDIDFSTPRSDWLYVLELAADGVLAFEAGFETGEFPPAVLLEISNIGRRLGERALSSLRASSPSPAVSRSGGTAGSTSPTRVFAEFGGRLLNVTR